MKQFFKKNPILRSFWTIFVQIWGKLSFSGKKALSILKYSNYLLWSKKSENSYNPFLIKIRIAEQTDRGYRFYKTLRSTGVQKIKFGTEKCDFL